MNPNNVRKQVGALMGVEKELEEISENFCLFMDNGQKNQASSL